MDLANQLKQAGLNISEIKIYIYLLENGLSTPPKVSQGTFVARTNCYNVLQSLKEKGLIEEQLIRSRKAYLASDPESIVRSLQKKKEVIEQILPDLRGIYTTQKNKPKIKFYDGAEQIKEIYLQSLRSDQIFAIGSTNQIEKLLPGFLKHYFNEIKRKGIFFKDTLTLDSKNIAETTQQELRAFYDFRLLPKEYKDPPTDILIWENNIALLTLQEPVFGTILTNPLLAQTFKMLFNLLWNK
jgi:sugar-specific transcriptional regulator TrmB